MDFEPVRRGAVAGMLGGAAMAMWSMAAFAAAGPGVWQPLDLIAHTVWRGAPLDGTYSGRALLLGLALHMGTSAMLGVLIATAARVLRTRAAGVGVLGMAVGTGTWLVNQYGIWRALDATAAHDFTPWIFAVGHLMFGAATAVALVLWAARSGRSERTGTYAGQGLTTAR